MRVCNPHRQYQVPLALGSLTGGEACAGLSAADEPTVSVPPKQEMDWREQMLKIEQVPRGSTPELALTCSSGREENRSDWIEHT